MEAKSSCNTGSIICSYNAGILQSLVLQVHYKPYDNKTYSTEHCSYRNCTLQLLHPTIQILIVHCLKSFMKP